MFALSRRKKIARLLIAAILLVPLLAILGTYIHRVGAPEDVHATIGPGDYVMLHKSTQPITYGSWETYFYYVYNESSGEAYVAFCAEPSKTSPMAGGPYVAVDRESHPYKDMIKLLIHVYLDAINDSSSTWGNYVFGSYIQNPYLLYAYTHATVGFLYSGDTTGLEGSLYTYITSTIPDRLNYISQNDSTFFEEAKNHQLLAIDEYSDSQDIVWMVPPDGSSQDVYGDLEIIKYDVETEASSTQGNAFFQGIIFSVYNASGTSIVYNGQTYADGAKIIDLNTDAYGRAYLSNLPVGTYRVVETASNSSYIINTSSQEVTIATAGEIQTVIIRNQVVRGDVRFVKIEKNSGDKMANIPFRITSVYTGESHVVVTDANGVVDTSAVTHSNHTNGYDSTTNFDGIINQGYGTWFGLNSDGSQVAVNDSLGALPYDVYEITEISCEQNKNCKDVTTTKKTVTIDSDKQVVDLGNWENDCSQETPPDYSIGTTAVDGADGDKEITPDGTVIIKDTISYCLKAGESYTIKGELRNASTGDKIMVNGTAVEQTMLLTPTADCGQTEMTFSFDASALNGVSNVVVFEYAYKGSELVASHAKLDSPEQTVHVSEPTPPPVPDDGEIVIVKHDKETGSCKAQGAAHLEGAKFEIRNASSHSISYKGNTIPAGGVVAIIEIDGTSCSASISDLPYGPYEIIEIEAGEGYSVDPNARITVEVNENQKTIEQTFDNQVIRGDVRLAKSNQKTGEMMANIPFRITSLTTGESHIVVTDSKGIMSTASAFAIHSNNTNGYDALDIYNIVHHGYGTWFGLSVDGGNVAVNDSLGALPYDSYEITELACFGNRFCADISSEKRTFTVNTSMSIVMLDEWENDCVTLSARTNAVDQSDGDKEITSSGKVRIKDTIKYCLVSGKEFTFKGVLMDRTTGKELLINGEKVEQTITITPSTDCGEAEMVFEFDATGLGDIEIVVFEYIYLEDELILTHTDINDADQTVQLKSPEGPKKPDIPNTGSTTSDLGGNQNVLSIVSIAIAAIITPSIVYVGIRYTSRRQALKFHKQL